MDIITVVHADSSSPTGPRNPLLPRTTSPQPVPAKNLRRKGSFIRPTDSSEESPLSSNNSIFEAFLFSNSNSEDSAYKPDTSPPSKHAVSGPSTHNDENMRQPSTSTRSEPTANTEFLYGHGTVLDTITEQKSYGTIRSVARTKSADDISTIRGIGRAKSADDLSTTPLLGHRDSFVLAKEYSRRQQSFSLDDLWSIKNSYHNACAMIDQAARRRLSIHEVYAQPKEPLLAPPERPDTPPGCPSWTEAQRPGPRQHLIPHHTRLQRLLRMPSSGLTLSPTPSRSFFTGRVSSAPGLTRLPPRFRVPKSVYSALETHPFSSAPVQKVDPEPPSDAPRPTPAPIPNEHPQTSPVPAVAPVTAPSSKTKGKAKGKAKSKLVRFTPSATARDSEMNLQRAMEATSSTALHPLVDNFYDQHPLPAAKKSDCPHRKGRQVIDGGNRRFVNTSMHAQNVPLGNHYLPLSSIPSAPRLTLPPYIRGLQPRSNPSASLHVPPHLHPLPPAASPNLHNHNASRRASLSPSLISDINAESTRRSSDLDLSIIDLEDENENRARLGSRGRCGTPLTSRPASACTSTRASSSGSYWMTGALHIPEAESPGCQAVHVPILTGARMLDVVSPCMRMGEGSGNGNGNGVFRHDENFDRGRTADVQGDVDEPFCWKCKVVGAK
ncbi:hypothetical protein DSL72_004196 [Monilinia vaccinii-corymbosi]|uniref:Uncharacterized protein n=1 Tax=Monilinia vaccinii-corymbosi TaxID=61207 RepID=A0A8A3NZV8_9HELO|nr:hypothetical protein DSL72_004196 [Monilinia vaccinii-corymbosi]